VIDMIDVIVCEHVFSPLPIKSGDATSSGSVFSTLRFIRACLHQSDVVHVVIVG